MDDDTIGLREAAAQLQLVPRAVMALVDEGELTATVVMDAGQSRVRFRRRDVERLVAER